MWRSVKHSCRSRHRQMTARLEVLERRTLLSGFFPDGRHAIHIAGTRATGTAAAWIDTKGTPSGGTNSPSRRSAHSPVGGKGDVRIAANAVNNPLYAASTIGSAATGRPSGYVYSFDGAEHVVYRDLYGQIQELWYSPSNGWRHNPYLTFPGPAGDPVGYNYSVDQTEHIVYRGLENHIEELWYGPSLAWHHDDLSAETRPPTPPATPPPTPTASSGRSTSSTAASTATSTSCGMARPPVGATTTSAPPPVPPPPPATRPATPTASTGPSTSSTAASTATSTSCGSARHEDGTRTTLRRTGAPAAASDPAGYTYSVLGTQHVVYRGVDGHIHELWYGPSSGRRHNDLSAATGAPAAAGDPAGYNYSVDGTEHVVYRGVDGHIHELWFRPSSGWHHNDLSPPPAPWPLPAIRLATRTAPTGPSTSSTAGSTATSMSCGTVRGPAGTTTTWLTPPFKRDGQIASVGAGPNAARCRAVTSRRPHPSGLFRNDREDHPCRGPEPYQRSAGVAASARGAG